MKRDDGTAVQVGDTIRIEGGIVHFDAPPNEKRKECGACRHWQAGECFRFPPQMAPYPMDNQHPIFYVPQPCRSQVGASERACGEWSAAS